MRILIRLHVNRLIKENSATFEVANRGTLTSSFSFLFLITSQQRIENGEQKS